MTDRELKLITGALLHDIGKVIYRGGDGRKHSISGYEFLKDEAGITDGEVLDAVRYHHGEALAKANINDNALAYIVYIADNIAAASDRREADNEEKGFRQEIPLQSIFNILNGNNKKFHYRPKALDDMAGINMPTDEEIPFDKHFYQSIKAEILDTLKGVENRQEEYIHSLLSTMEAYLTYIPSSTAVHELADISLYDHVKMTAAYSSCIYQYMEEKENFNYRQALFNDAKEFYNQKAFRLFSMDISGIQKFIYTIHSKGALKMLRSRSFYLEILMEHMIDQILERCSLSRTNLIYSGGGHCYILLANTETTAENLKQIQKEFNEFFIQEFDVSLYAATASVECSAHDLENIPAGSYSELFRRLSSLLSEQKSGRYTASQIIWLNHRKRKDATRECRVCKSSAVVNDDNMCPFCSAMDAFSGSILYKDFFTVIQEKREGSIPLPGGRYLIAHDEEQLKKCMEEDDYYVRTYGKNRFFTGKSVTTKLWVGDYVPKDLRTGKQIKGKTTEEYAREAKGIDRIGVLRADVDNLGHAFVSGFDERYTTLSRTATFSRQLSLFFKHHINWILDHGEYGMDGKPSYRNVTIVYSGGDDLFLVGSWNEVIEAAVDIRQQLDRYSLGALTISAGIGVYPSRYPLSVCADEVAELEEKSKNYVSPENQSKNAVTLFGTDISYSWKEFLERGSNDNKVKENFDTTFSWNEFKEKVIREKLTALTEFFGKSEERGKAFMYRLLDLMRNMDEKINLARFAYVLARLEPDEEKSKEQRESYRIFSRQMYEWVQKDTDRKQLIMAIYIYVYLHREGGSEV